MLSVRHITRSGQPSTCQRRPGGHGGHAPFPAIPRQPIRHTRPARPRTVKPTRRRALSAGLRADANLVAHTLPDSQAIEPRALDMEKDIGARLIGGEKTRSLLRQGGAPTGAAGTTPDDCF